MQVDEWAVKQMKTKWGTCNIKAHRLWLNLELIKKPARCLECIIDAYPLFEPGEAAARLLHDLIVQDITTPRKILFPVHLVARNSRASTITT